jgi:hypothetical protein
VPKRKSRDNKAQLDELGSDPGQVGPTALGNRGTLRVSRRSLILPTKASKTLPTLNKHMRRKQSAASRMLLTIPRGLYASVRIMPGQMTLRPSAESSDPAG